MNRDFAMKALSAVRLEWFERSETDPGAAHGKFPRQDKAAAYAAVVVGWHHAAPTTNPRRRPGRAIRAKIRVRAANDSASARIAAAAKTLQSVVFIRSLSHIPIDLVDGKMTRLHRMDASGWREATGLARTVASDRTSQEECVSRI